MVNTGDLQLFQSCFEAMTNWRRGPANGITKSARQKWNGPEIDGLNEQKNIQEYPYVMSVHCAPVLIPFVTNTDLII